MGKQVMLSTDTHAVLKILASRAKMPMSKYIETLLRRTNDYSWLRLAELEKMVPGVQDLVTGLVDMRRENSWMSDDMCRQIVEKAEARSVSVFIELVHFRESEIEEHAHEVERDITE